MPSECTKFLPFKGRFDNLPASLRVDQFVYFLSEVLKDRSNKNFPPNHVHCMFSAHDLGVSLVAFISEF